MAKQRPKARARAGKPSKSRKPARPAKRAPSKKARATSAAKRPRPAQRAKRAAAKPRARAARGPSPIPAGFPAITAHLVVRDAAAAIDFYVEAFGATEIARMPGPDGRVMHAELRIGDSVLMLGEEAPEWGARSPQTLGGSPVTIHHYVADADKAFARAVAAGAMVTMPLGDAFWGDRYGKLADPFGHQWSLATHIKDLSPAEMKRAMDKAMTDMAGMCAPSTDADGARDNSALDDGAVDAAGHD